MIVLLFVGALDLPPRGPGGDDGLLASPLPLDATKGAADAEGLRPGATVSLRATHPLGVPLHAQAESRKVSERLADGSVVRIVGVDSEGHWLQIEFGKRPRRAFILEKYVGGVVKPDAAQGGAADEALGQQKPSPAIGLSGCQARVASADRSPSMALRVGSFNVRWFPDGQPGKKPRGKGTDVLWVACQIAELDASVVAVQEFKTTERARSATKRLLAELGRLTKGSWKAFFDECPLESSLHVGMLYDSTRLQLKERRVEASLNPLGEACAGSLRPGLVGRFQTKKGQSLEVVSVHLKSGTDRRSFGLRDRTFSAMGRLPRTPGVPRVVAGDFNTMGCKDCQPEISAGAERASRQGGLASRGDGFIEPPLGCSHVHRSRPELLDGFVVSGPALGTAGASVAGACRQTSCAKGPVPKEVLERVSDHCPLVLDLGTRPSGPPTRLRETSP